ncbi:glycosyltransferase family 2 protein [Breoghania sp. L-A4]|uniref:glycosyltransferase family 2 protein n=1 Tax=Breoghania sp. L-A4 TaxID=2304600 RepID=UPI000E35DC39|nr:glycosyltransferase family 2 protein [Breoghania sp. L-A4]AXS42036.1 glycosyltransferase [Breoghania sp. L-A4]
MQHDSNPYTQRRAASRPARPRLSIIVPMYNEEAVVDVFLEAMQRALGEARSAGSDFSHAYVFVDDGSRDSTAEIIARRLSEGVPGTLIGLSRNFGKEAALTAGLDHADGDMVVVIDADLQDPPELIGPMIEHWRAGHDVVYGLRVNRSSDSVLKRRSSQAFYRLFNRLANIDMPANAGDFRLMDRAVVEALKSLPERNRFMKGLFAWVGFSAVAVPYTRPERAAGTSKWNYWKLWNFALDGLIGFTSIPLRMWFYCGALIAALSFAYALYLVIRVLLYGVDMPGYASLMTAVLFFSGIQLLSVGIIGEYVARLFTETKCRPIYVVADVIGGAAADGEGDAKAGDQDANPPAQAS